MRAIDLTGQRFGLLVACCPEKDRNGRSAWRCICDCGTSVVVASANLRAGRTASCGCQWHRRTSPIIRALSRLRKTENGCWEWMGRINNQGYGVIGSGGRHSTEYVHRLSYLYFRSEIPEDLVVDHLCRNRRCANPYHLEVVTQIENIRRGNSPAAVTRRNGFCCRGHPMTAENIYIRSDGHGMRCRECARIRQKTEGYKARRNARRRAKR